MYRSPVATWNAAKKLWDKLSKRDLGLSSSGIPCLMMTPATHGQLMLDSYGSCVHSHNYITLHVPDSAEEVQAHHGKHEEHQEKEQSEVENVPDG